MARAAVEEDVPDEAMPLPQCESAEPPQRQPTNWAMLTPLLAGAIPEYFLSQIFNPALRGEGSSSRLHRSRRARCSQLPGAWQMQAVRERELA